MRLRLHQTDVTPCGSAIESDILKRSGKGGGGGNGVTIVEATVI
jgi:hypothetical protein